MIGVRRREVEKKRHCRSLCKLSLTNVPHIELEPVVHNTLDVEP